MRMKTGVDVAWRVNEEIWNVCRFREGVYQGRVCNDLSACCHSPVHITCVHGDKGRLTKSKVQVEGGHGRGIGISR